MLAEIKIEKPDTITIHEVIAFKTKGYAFKTKVEEEKQPKGNIMYVLEQEI